jgi:DNA-binding MarR family transcriptional regulator
VRAPTSDEFLRAAALRAGLRRVLRRSEQISRRNGLTPQQYQLLLMIKGAPDGSERATVGSLVERLQLTQSTVTELVQRADEAGLVSRLQSQEDGRVVYLTLTEEGENRIRSALAEHGEERTLLAELVSSPRD